MQKTAAMLTIDDLTDLPGKPELVLSEAADVNGLDLLGLRAPAEAVSNWLMSGVTTVTPAVRYFSLRCWLILQYLKLQGPNRWERFAAFAAKIEAAVAYSAILVHDQTAGVVGRNHAAATVAQNDSTLTLKRLTKILAAEVYAGPSSSLGFGESDKAVPTLTRERGALLADAFDKQVANTLLTEISLSEDEQTFERTRLEDFGQDFSIGGPSASESQILIDAILPQEPHPKRLQIELNRIASYCLLLHLSSELAREVQEIDVYRAVTQQSLAKIPAELHSICDGWVQFAVRDLLVLVHEAAVSHVLLQLSQVPTSEKRERSGDVISALVAGDLDDTFNALSLSVTADEPIAALCDEVDVALGQVVDADGLRRWDGTLSETLLFEKDAWLRQADCLGLLPIAWVIAARRLEPGIGNSRPEFQFDLGAGISRIGVADVVLPAVKAWKTSDKTIREMTAWLISRSVDQHLRIAWSRLAREPHKDVGLIRSDGDEWIYQKGFAPGRATSRLYRAINWLYQLGLVDDTGATARGMDVLQQGLSTLRLHPEGRK